MFSRAWQSTCTFWLRFGGGSPLNLTYEDTAGLALTRALHLCVLRYPSGTGGTWDPMVVDISRHRHAPATAVGARHCPRDQRPAGGNLRLRPFCEASWKAKRVL